MGIDNPKRRIEVIPEADPPAYIPEREPATVPLEQPATT